MKFSLAQLAICVAIILFIAYVVIKGYNPKQTKIVVPENPQITIPFQQIKMK